MAEIFQFVPKRALEASENLKSFIDKCQNDLIVFGGDLDWNSWNWKGVVQFTRLGTNSRSAKAEDALDPEFINFAKAYFRYQQGHKPTRAKNETKAFKTVEAALQQVNNCARISGITNTVLDEAAKLMRENYAKASAYHGGRELERMAKFLSRNKLVPNDLSTWKSPIRREKDLIQTGVKAKERREKKLPSEESLNAIAEIFANNPSHHRDIFTSSTFAMLMCAPSRISEILELPVDCEVEEKDSKGIVRYGWRFYSGKGFGGDIKWIPTEMVSIGKEAIRRIKNLTEEGRRLAKWMETHPDKFFRRKGFPDIPDDQTMTLEQIKTVMGWGCSDKSLRDRLRANGFDGEQCYNSLWEFVLSSSRQPKQLPWLNKARAIKYSDALFCMTTDIFGSKQSPHYPVLWVPKNNDFNNDLKPERIAKDQYQTLFDRHGYLTNVGDRIKLTSHQARHLLNTIAQKGGLSNLEIAKWSGRAEASQNRVYNHMSEFEMVAQAEELDTNLTLFGPVGESQKHMPITIQEFNTLEKGALHVTEFGVCVHDFTMSPCQKFRDCLNCTEQVCIKGDDTKLERIKERLSEVRKQYTAAKAALDEEAAGADRWYEHHKNTALRLEELISILEDPKLKNGAMIKLRNDQEFSLSQRASKKDIGEITELLGGSLG